MLVVRWFLLLVSGKGCHGLPKYYSSLEQLVRLPLRTLTVSSVVGSVHRRVDATTSHYSCGGSQGHAPFLFRHSPKHREGSAPAARDTCVLLPHHKCSWGQSKCLSRSITPATRMWQQSEVHNSPVPSHLHHRCGGSQGHSGSTLVVHVYQSLHVRDRKSVV